MAINPIDSNTKPASYKKACALGVLGGMAAQYVIPVSKKEYDMFVSDSVKKGKSLLTKEDINSLAKASRSSFDFAVVSAALLMAYTFVKNM